MTLINLDAGERLAGIEKIVEPEEDANGGNGVPGGEGDGGEADGPDAPGPGPAEGGDGQPAP